MHCTVNAKLYSMTFKLYSECKAVQTVTRQEVKPKGNPVSAKLQRWALNVAEYKNSL